MSYATNVGKAIALQTPDRGDYWLRQTAQDLKLQKQAEAKAKADQADKLATIYDIDLKGGYLPAWGKAAKETYAGYVNAVAELRAQDPNVSYAQLILLKNEAKSKILSIKEDNDRVVTYLGNPGLYKDAAWSNAAYTSDDFNEISKHNNPTYYNVDASTGYTFINPIKIVSKDIKFPSPTGEKWIKSVNRGGRNYNIYENTYPQDTEKTTSAELKTDFDYVQGVMWELSQNPMNRKNPNETVVDYSKRMLDESYAEIDRRVANSMPKTTEKEEPISLGDGGSGGGLKKKNFAMMDGTMNATSATTGKLGKYKTKEKPVYVPNMITLESNGKYIDYNDFNLIPDKFVDPVSGKERNISFGFKPDKVIVLNINGKLTKLVRGSLVKSDQGEASPLYKFLGLEAPTNEKWTNTRDILVPYEEVKSLIEFHNEMSDVNDFVSKTSLNTGGGGGYTPAQEQGIKNVMQTNGITRDEAIQALKAANKL